MFALHLCIYGNKMQDENGKIYSLGSIIRQFKIDWNNCLLNWDIKINMHEPISCFSCKCCFIINNTFGLNALFTVCITVLNSDSKQIRVAPLLLSGTFFLKQVRLLRMTLFKDYYYNILCNDINLHSFLNVFIRHTINNMYGIKECPQPPTK